MKSRNIYLSLSFFLFVACAAACGSDSDDEDGVNNGAPTNNGMMANNGSIANNGSMPNNGTAVNNGAPTNNGAATNNGVNGSGQCPPEARLVYLVEADIENPDAQGTLIRFTPPERDFAEVGRLNCPVQDGSTPFSMSVDRDGTAWILYSSGNLYRVSTTDASCEATSFQTGQHGYQVFGMGFVLNTPNQPDETLYVAGGGSPGSVESPRIGYITFPDLVLHDVTEITGWPEMSGTAAAELWAFLPNPIAGSARVSLLVPATGEELEKIPVDSVISGSPNAWAFAHWGGRFYLFYKSQSDLSTNVFEVQRDGTVEEIVSDTGRYIVGAGVSTCAPLVLQ